MNESVLALFQKADQLRRALRKRRKLALVTAWVVGLGCAVVVPLVPQRYEATARVYVDTQTVLKPLMAGLAFQPDIDEQVHMLAKTLISRPNVEQLLDAPGYAWPHTGPQDREIEISRLMNEIKVVSAGTGNLYEISYRDVQAGRAQQVVTNTVQLFVSSSTEGKKRDSADASRFINEQIKAYDAKLAEAENRLKEFKLRHFGVTGVSNQDYFARMSALSDEVSKLQVDLQAAEQSRDALRRELSGEDPQLPLDTSQGAGPIVQSETDARLEALHKQLDDLLRRYTDQHPDVIAVRRSIAQLEQQRRDERAARTNGTSKPPAATSPVYQKIRISLAETEAQVASLRAQLAAQQQRLAEVRSQATQVPEVEAEYTQLNRDYDILRKNYDQLVARRESASLGVKIDETEPLADFRVVEPPRVSRFPVFPSHLHLALISLLLTLVAAVGSVLIAETLRPTLDDTAVLQQLIGHRKVIGAVSVARNAAVAQQERGEFMRFTLSAAVLATGLLGWLAWIALRATH
jgi:polysaccharide chain length determinant protein (PEP-CTERM system associated)